jgi:DNA-binding beta-propeller fold protein YncE
LSTPRSMTALLSFPDLRSRRGLIALGTGFLASLLLLAGVASSVRADDRVYWVNGTAVDASPISHADLDGSGGDDLDTTGAASAEPRGVAIDTAAGTVYWTNRGNNQISFANLDGTGVARDLDTTGSALLDHPNGAAIHPAQGRIYWASEYNDTLSSASLLGGGSSNLISGGAVGTPNTPMVDPGLPGSEIRPARLYWANTNATTPGIYYAGLNGGPGTPLVTPTPGGPTVANPHGVALDPDTNKIYWANPGVEDDTAVPPVNEPAHVISYIDLDNLADRGDLLVGDPTDPNNPTPVNRPIGVAIDPDENKIYWANYGNNTIAVAELEENGTANNASTLNINGATPSRTRSPVLLKTPISTGAPTISGGSSVGSVLTCSQGSWEQDQVASWLYRAPSEFEYSWTLDDEEIQGATTSTHTASEEGSYSCTVKGSNEAGEDTSDPSAARLVSNPAPSGPPPAGPPPAGSPSQPSAPPAGPPSTGGTSKPPTSTPKPAFGAKTLVNMGVAARRIRGSSPIKVVVRNANGFQVSGRLSARASKRASGSRAFLVGSKGKATVTLRLSKSLRQLLKRKGKLSLRLTATVKDPAGGTRTVSKTVSLRLKTAGR